MNRLQQAIEKLRQDFDAIKWQYPQEESGAAVKTQLWPGNPAEDVMLCVYKGRDIRESFHRQDCFFFNFAYKGNYGALSARFDHRFWCGKTSATSGGLTRGMPSMGRTPQMDAQADEFIRLRFDDPTAVRCLLELMIIEYA